MTMTVDPPRVARAEGVSVAAVVAAVVVPPLGIVLGHMARGQALRDGERPSPVATFGMVLGYVLTFLIVAAVFAVMTRPGISPVDQFTACINAAVANGTNPDLCQ